MDIRKAGYHSYLLRLWRGVTAGDPNWRASLEDPQTGERHGFADLEELFGYLEAKTGESGDALAGPPGEPGY